MDPAEPGLPSQTHISIGTSERGDGSCGEGEIVDAGRGASGSVHGSYRQNPERIKNFHLLKIFHCQPYPEFYTGPVFLLRPQLLGEENLNQ